MRLVEVGPFADSKPETRTMGIFLLRDGPEPVRKLHPTAVPHLVQPISNTRDDRGQAHMRPGGAPA